MIPKMHIKILSWGIVPQMRKGWISQTTRLWWLSTLPPLLATSWKRSWISASNPMHPSNMCPFLLTKVIKSGLLGTITRSWQRSFSGMSWSCPMSQGYSHCWNGHPQSNMFQCSIGGFRIIWNHSWRRSGCRRKPQKTTWRPCPNLPYWSAVFGARPGFLKLKPCSAFWKGFNSMGVSWVYLSWVQSMPIHFPNPGEWQNLHHWVAWSWSQKVVV